MRCVLCAAIGLAVPGALVAAPPTDRPIVRSTCPDDALTHQARQRQKGEFHRLTDLPPGDPIAAVLKVGPDGCIIRVRFPAAAPRQTPKR